MGGMYIGTYTKKEGHVDGKADGIYYLTQDIAKGTLGEPRLVAEVTNPSFVRLSPNRKHLYAVSELGPADGPAGELFVFDVLENDSLAFRQKISTEGYAPCHISMDPSGTYVFVANYVGGVVMSYKRSADGSLTVADKLQLEGAGPHPEQESSHPHATLLSPDGKYVLIPDKGADKIWIRELDMTSGKLLEAEDAYATSQPGAGPRHIVFEPQEQNFAVVINELGGSVSSFAVGTGNQLLEAVQSITTLPAEYTEWNACADIHFHPGGKFFYASNRGHNSLAAFQFDTATGNMSALGQTSTHGQFPRNFTLSPDGLFLYAANQNSDNIARYAVNQETGALTFLDELKVPTPVCLEFK